MSDEVPIIPLHPPDPDQLILCLQDLLEKAQAGKLRSLTVLAELLDTDRCQVTTILHPDSDVPKLGMALQTTYADLQKHWVRTT